MPNALHNRIRDAIGKPVTARWLGRDGDCVTLDVGQGDDMDSILMAEKNPDLKAKLAEHIGHDVVAVGYGYDKAADLFANVAVECEGCGCVLIDENA